MSETEAQTKGPQVATAPAPPARAAVPATPAANPRLEGLAFELDDGTRKSHSVAENTAFVTGFFKGLATEKSFSKLLAGLYHVYDAMEAALDETECAANRALDFSALRRRAALEADMAHFFGPEWRTSAAARPSAAATRYAARVREVAAGPTPELLIGHLYSRYLGDLFGGQMMAGMASKSLGLDANAADGGLAFYRFDEIANTKAFIDEWYTALNALELTAAQKSAIVDEANVVFQLNIDLFDELEGNAAKALFAVLFESLFAWARPPPPSA